MSLIETAAALIISVALMIGGLLGGKAVYHSGKVTAIESNLRAVAQKSVEYANNSGSYAGLSCTGLQGVNLETPSGCSSGSFSSILSEGVLTVAPSATDAGFILSFTPTDTGLSAADCPVIGRALSTTLSSYSCTGSPWTFTYGN